MTDRLIMDRTSPSTRFVLEADFDWSEPDFNRSVASIYMRATNTGNASSNFGGPGVHLVSIDGIGEIMRQEGTPFLPGGVPNGTNRWRKGGRYTIQHDADGTRAPARIRMVTDYDGERVEHVFDLLLPAIPRATVPQIRVGSTPVTTFDAGTALTIFLNRASANFTHDVTYQFGGASGTIATGAGVSAAWTPPLSLLAQYPDATSGAGKVVVVTKNGSTVIGTREVSFTMTAPASVIPTISAINVSDGNPDVASAIGGFVQGQSILKATVVAAGVHGSTIASSVYTVDGTTVPSGDGVPLGTAGTRAVAAAATDSRGRVGTSSGTITVLAYADPVINTFTVERCTAAGVADPNGSHLKVALNASVTGLTVSGAQKQNLTIRIRTRPRGGSWTDRNVITQATLTYNSSFVISGGAQFPPSDAFEVEVRLSDKLQTVPAPFFVGTAAAVLHADGGKVAVGKRAEASGPSVQLAGPAKTYGNHDVDGTVKATAVEVTGGMKLIPATTAQAAAGTANDVPLTPASLLGRTATDARSGLVELATAAEVRAGTDGTRAVTPAGLAAKIASGIFNTSTDAAGDVTVTHGMSAAPSVVIPVTNGDAPAFPMGISAHPHSITATTFKIRISRHDTNTAFVSNPVAGVWIAIA